MLEIRAPQTHAEFEQVLELRYQVLDEPAGVPRKTDLSRHDVDPESINIVALLNGLIVSTVRFDRLDASSFLVRRMATDASLRGKGIGSKVLAAAEETAVKRGADRVILHARSSAVGFYKKSGYAQTGRSEVHDGDISPEMIKRLS